MKENVELISMEGIAALANRHIDLVRQYPSRYPRFPKPQNQDELTGTKIKRFYDASEVKAWFAEMALSKRAKNFVPHQIDLDLANAFLRGERS